MDLSTYLFLVRSDLYRVQGRTGGRAFLYTLMTRECFAYCFWLRTCQFLRGKTWARVSLLPVARWIYRRSCFRYGIAIPYAAEIGAGLYIGHWGGIVVNMNATIGCNCNLSHGVTIGRASRGQREGSPRIGDDVYLGPGCKVFGAVTIGDRAAIGANAVVTKDVPPDAVMGGVPAEVISWKGSGGYVRWTDYGSVDRNS